MPKNGTARLGTVSRILGADKSKQAIEFLATTAQVRESELLAVKSLHSAFRLYTDWNAEHSVRVGLHMANFAEVEGYSVKDARRLGLHSCLHDIGKLKIPNSVLDKPGVLEADEREIVEAHVLDSHHCMDFLDPVDYDIASMVIKHHHENFDGTGYPDRMAGADTPLYVQMSRICDFYDALTFDRPYRKGHESGKTLEIMEASTGLFNPKLLQSFKANIKRIDQIPEYS